MKRRSRRVLSRGKTMACVDPCQTHNSGGVDFIAPNQSRAYGLPRAAPLPAWVRATRQMRTATATVAVFHRLSPPTALPDLALLGIVDFRPDPCWARYSASCGGWTSVAHRARSKGDSRQDFICISVAALARLPRQASRPRCSDFVSSSLVLGAGDKFSIHSPNVLMSGGTRRR